jgi:hypothetical protein
MLSEALNYPRESDHVLKTVLIGGVLSLLSVLVIPAFILGGYGIRVLRHTTLGDEELPQFGDWGKLALDGVKGLGIGIGYILVPMALFALSIGVLSGTLQMIGLIVSAVTYVAAIYCLPAATTVFAREERVGAAFTMSNLRSVVTSRRYVGGWLRAVAIGFVAGLVMGVIGLVPILGAIASVFIAFYVNLVTAYLFGHAVADAERLSVPQEEQPAARPIA